MQESCAFKKLSAMEKVHILRITIYTKLIAYLWGEKSAHLKISATKKVNILTGSCEFWHFLVEFIQRNSAFKKYHPHGKFIFPQLVAKNREF